MPVTRWSPDTCGCVLEYSWDASVPADSRVHTYSATIRTCPTHPGLAAAALYQAILNENQTKNRVLGRAVQISTKLSTDGQTLKDGITYVWTFAGTNSRSLTVAFTGVTLTNQDKSSLQTAINGMAFPIPVTVA